MEKIIYIITGQTAVGKTELALQWAEKHDAEIVSCDSLLFYKGMDIGTAKPTREEQGRVKHHCIDIVGVKEQFSIKDYLELVVSVVSEIHSRGKKVLVTGGSGFYLKSFMAPVVDNIEVSDEIKLHVKTLEEGKGLLGLVSQLEALNGGAVEGVDLKNPRRVVKALQRCIATGKTLVELKAEFDELKTPFEDFEKKVCLLQRDDSILNQRVILRVKAMLELGLVDEVRRLKKEGLEENASAAGAIGYRETLAWLDKGSSDINELGIDIAKNTMSLVAKQRKWFRHQLTPDTEVDLDHKYDLGQLFLL